MPTYLIVNAAITDPGLLDNYRAAVGATLAGHDVVVRVSTNEAETVEGEPKGPRVVVLEFPDREAFRAWYDSPAYQDIVGMRLGSTDGFAVLVEGR
jgi:uncharacterized protein (DUF1330 family)